MFCFCVNVLSMIDVRALYLGIFVCLLHVYVLRIHSILCVYVCYGSCVYTMSLVVFN